MRHDQSRLTALPRLLTQINLTLQHPIVSQLNQLCKRLVQRHKLPLLLRGWIIPITDIDGASFLFLGTDDYMYC